jgi:hypothetical protein
MVFHCAYIPLFSLSIPSLGCFYILATVNHAAMNIQECRCLLNILILFSFVYVSESGIAESYGSYIC